MADDENQGLELLKLHFGKSKDGRWEIAAMAGIPLKASEDTDEAFFAIRDDLVVAQPALAGTIRFVLGQSIVPIVTHVQGEPVLRCLGTGFFISCTGLLITAAHVITDPIERQYGGIKELDELTWHARDLHIGVMIPLNPMFQGDGYIFRPIEWATFLSEQAGHPLPIAGVNLKLKSDIAICKVAPIAEDIPHQPLTIVQPGMAGTGMAVGKTATAVGYGEMRDVEMTRQADHVMSGDFSFALHASTGVIVERFPNNFTEPRVPTPGPCFSAQLRLPGGMSGSPIFDHEGIYVHGVVSKGWVDESGLASFGYGSMLAHSLHLPIKPLGGRSLLELHKSEEHGFPKLSGPGT